MRLLLATTNKNKIREIRHLLHDLSFELVTLAEWPLVLPPEETGLTFEEIARAKALYYAAATGELTVAEDSGLVIDALDHDGPADPASVARLDEIRASMNSKRGDTSAAG